METPMPGGEQPQIEIKETPAPQEPDINSINLSALSDADLEALESGDVARISEALKLPAPPAPVEKLPVEKLPVEDQGPDRISLKAISDRNERVMLAQATQMVRDGGAKNLQEALAKVFKFEVEKPQVDPEKPEHKTTPEIVPQSSPEVERIEAEIAETSKAYKEAKTVTFDVDAEQELVMKLIDLKADLKLAKIEAAKQTEVRGTFEAQESASRQRAISIYGEMMTDPDSEFNELLEVEILLAERKNDPILTNPDWPEKIATRTYEKHKAKLGDGVADPDTKASEIPPHPGNSSRMPGAPVGRDAQPTSISVNSALAELDRMSPDERMAVLQAADKLTKR